MAPPRSALAASDGEVTYHQPSHQHPPLSPPRTTSRTLPAFPDRGKKGPSSAMKPPPIEEQPGPLQQHRAGQVREGESGGSTGQGESGQQVHRGVRHGSRGAG